MRKVMMFAKNAEFWRWEMCGEKTLVKERERWLSLAVSKHRKCNGASVATGTGSFGSAL